MARNLLKSKNTEDMADEVRYWLDEIAASKKREKDYQKEGRRIREIYAGEKKEVTPFNVLFSNTETMAPALYSSIPRPIVTRRYKDADPIGKAAAEAGERALSFMLDTNIDGYETFNDIMKASVLDGLLPGRGIASVKYDVEIDESSGTPVKKYDLVCTRTRSWDRVLFGYAKKWSETPWIAYEEFIEKDEGVRLFGKDIANKIKFTKQQKGKDDDGTGTRDEMDTGERKTALIYQIWDKSGGKKIRYVSPHYKDGYLLVKDDTLKLTGFYDTPKPLQFVDKTDDTVPTSLYSLYENQAKELNEVTVRINRLISAMKVRGFYDSALGIDIENLEDVEENSMHPTSKGGSLAAAGGLDKAIWLMPIDKMQAVLRELYISRDQTKQTIYEIIGIADILRGASKAQETLGAQQIKTQWGTLRLKPKQYEVQRYARDLLRMMLEVAAHQFDEQTWAKMTGLPFLTQEQVQQAQMKMQQMQQQWQQAVQMQDPSAQQLQQQFQQAQMQAQQQITWAQVTGVLQNDLQRAYKIDIETNSTLEPEAAEDQKQIADLMAAIGQFLQGIGPLVQEGVMPFEIAKAMLVAISRRFRFGDIVEDQLDQMQPPKPKPEEDNGAEMAKQQLAAQQQEMASQQKQMALQAENLQLKTQLQDLQGKQQLADQGTQLDKRSTDLDVRELSLNSEKELFRLEQQRAQETLNNKAQGETQKLEHKRQLTGLESKQAKTEQGVAKAVDSKTGQAVGQLKDGLKQVADTVAEHTEQIKQIAKLASAPRRRKAIRDAKGVLVGAEDEVIQ